MAAAAVPTTAVRPLHAGAGGAFEPEPGESWFNDVYTSCVEHAYRYAHMLTHDGELTEEIIADAFFRVWRSRHTYRATGSVLSWVLSITRNCAFDAIRKRKEVLALATLEENDIAEPVTDAPLLNHGDIAVIREALNHLTEEQQQVIFLRFYEELSHEKVAVRLGRSANAVRAVQFRALARLRKLLEAFSDDD
jgi:RNA polymerase sigma-70 factor (ECF subfamily)